MRAQSGFTLIEILMVVLLVSILAAVSIPQFIDFRVDARDAATSSAVGSLRTAVANQYANMNVRCNSAAGVYPGAAQLNANDVTSGAGAPCTTTQLISVTDRQFVASGTLPDNPWSGASAASKNAATACSGTGCNNVVTTNCAGAAYAATDGGWCYNATNGRIWANSANSTGPKKENQF